MKQFLYGRLKEMNDGYSFYIPPIKHIGILSKAVANHSLSGERKFLFLQNDNGVISFGVRERLDRKDFVGRQRYNFMGFQLEPEDTIKSLPFLKELRNKFPQITREANSCHDVLEKKPHSGTKLQRMVFKFDEGIGENNGWDEAVKYIRQHPESSFIMIFDEWGNNLPVVQNTHQQNNLIDIKNDTSYPELSNEEKVIVPPLGKLPRFQNNAVLPTSQNFEDHLGIFSDVELNEEEKTIVPKIEKPLEPEESKYLNWIKSFWDSIFNNKSNNNTKKGCD
jgi:hypothetical protein